MDKVMEQVRENCAHLQGKKLIVAVSGGGDSMVLLYALHRLRAELGLELTVCHFEHGIRGEESLADAALVEQTARQWGIPFCLQCEDILGRARKQNLEKVARDARYAFLRRLREEMGAACILTGHHADDNAETILMNLTRGCGLTGLTGMKMRQGELLRPLLWCSKQEILDFAQAHHLAYREDSTNQDRSYTRNRIRHEVLPTLKRLNPQLIFGVTQMSELLTQDEDCLQTLAHQSGYAQPKPYGYDLLQEVMAAPASIGNRVIYGALHSMVGREVSRQMIGDVRMLMGRETGKKKQIQGEVWAYRYSLGVHVVRRRERIDQTFELSSPGQSDTAFGRFVVTREQELRPPGENEAYFTGEGRLWVRARQTGECMVPFGRHTPKKLKTLMNDHNVSVFLRDLLPVILLDDQILYVARVGRSNFALAQPGQVWKITYDPALF